jgi:hypothetical protein
MRLIDADHLKKEIRWYFKPTGEFLEDCEKIDFIIDKQRELNILERDIGKEPNLEETVSMYHETRADGTGGFKSKTISEWHCPNCGWFVGELYSGFGRWHIQDDRSYCAGCGQRIDWTLPKAEEKRHYEERKEAEREEWEKKNGIQLDNMNERKRIKYGITKVEE